MITFKQVVTVVCSVQRLLARALTIRVSQEAVCVAMAAAVNKLSTVA